MSFTGKQLNQRTAPKGAGAKARHADTPMVVPRITNTTAVWTTLAYDDLGYVVSTSTSFENLVIPVNGRYRMDGSFCFQRKDVSDGGNGNTRVGILLAGSPIAYSRMPTCANTTATTNPMTTIFSASAGQVLNAVLYWDHVSASASVTFGGLESFLSLELIG